jgi:hypothetical protein
VLYHNGCGVARRDMIESARRIRENITEALGELPADSAARRPIERMRGAVHDFQSFIEENFRSGGNGGPKEAFYIAIGELREAVGSAAAELLQIYNIDPETALICLPGEVPDTEAGNSGLNRTAPLRGTAG